MYDFITVEFPSASKMPSRIASMTFWQERNKHEFATFQFRDWDMNFDDVRPGTPVRFVLASDQGSKEFNGYVHHVKPSVTPGVRSTEVHVIGASYYLKQKSQQVYKNVTASDIVRKIAKRNKFAYDVADHPRIYPQIAQAGLTDLEMLNKLAKQCGYSLRVTNAEIYFQPMTKLYEEMRENAPRFTLRDAQDPSGSNLYSFKPLIGESLEYDGEVKSAAAVGGVDRFTGKLIQLTNQKRPKPTKAKFEPEFFDSYLTNTVINDYETAKHESTSADNRTRFPYRAVAEVLGNPKLHPDMPVYIEGVGSNYSGYWVILETEHKVTSDSYNVQKYVTVLTLGTDSLGKAVAGADNKTIVSPAGALKRTIVPNVRQTNKKPVAKLSVGTAHPTKKTAPVGFGTINNRSKPKVASQVIIGKQWKSTAGNLKKTSKPASRPAIVVAKLRSSGVL